MFVATFSCSGILNEPKTDGIFFSLYSCSDCLRRKKKKVWKKKKKKKILCKKIFAKMGANYKIWKNQNIFSFFVYRKLIERKVVFDLKWLKFFFIIILLLIWKFFFFISIVDWNWWNVSYTYIHYPYFQYFIVEFICF